MLKNIGKYQKELASEQIMEFEQLSAKWLKFFDYE